MAKTCTNGRTII